jgi:hypothetical protein
MQNCDPGIAQPDRIGPVGGHHEDFIDGVAPSRDGASGHAGGGLPDGEDVDTGGRMPAWKCLRDTMREIHTRQGTVEKSLERALLQSARN